MEVFRCIRTRRTVRDFTPDPVPDAVIHKILQAARWAPSSSNTQPWHFIVVRERDTIAALGRICTQGAFIGQAPLAIAIAMAGRAPPPAGRRARLAADGTGRLGRGAGHLLCGHPRRTAAGSQNPAGHPRRAGTGYGAAFRLPHCPSARRRNAPQAAVGDRARRVLWAEPVPRLGRVLKLPTGIQNSPWISAICPLCLVHQYAMLVHG